MPTGFAARTRSFSGWPLRQLADRPGDKTTVEERDRYRQVIKEYRLLREDGALEVHLRDELYAAVLGIAFEMPLDYEGYCQLEACAGLAPGQLMHRSLLRAVGRARIDDLCVELILAGADADEFRTSSKAQVPLAGLVEAAADLRLDVTHRRAVFETALNEFLVRERDRRLDTQRLRLAVAEHVCLASAVQQIYQNSQYRLNALCTLLKLAYGQTLSRANIRTILSAVDGEPTSDLFFAVVDMSDPRDADFAERTFTRSLARRYDADTEANFSAGSPIADSETPLTRALGSLRTATTARAAHGNRRAREDSRERQPAMPFSVFRESRFPVTVRSQTGRWSARP